MEVNKIDFFRVQAKINSGEKPPGAINSVRYNFSKYNSIFLPEEINDLSKKLIQEELEVSEIKDTYKIPKQYEKLFSLYLRN